MLFCSLADVGQIFSRNMMHDAESFCFMSYLENFFFFSVLNLDMFQNPAPEKIVYTWQIKANGRYQ